MSSLRKRVNPAISDISRALDSGRPSVPSPAPSGSESADAMHDMMLMPLDRLRLFFDELQSGLDGAVEAAAEGAVPTASEAEHKTLKLLFEEVCTRLKYLSDVGIGYLTLDRQSRTLSGGEVQRINLTTALGTSLVNTLFVLDEPSIGLHPRDMERVIAVMIGRTTERDATGAEVEGVPSEMEGQVKVVCTGYRSATAQRTVQALLPWIRARAGG